jgi:hypothetical protein
VVCVIEKNTTATMRPDAVSTTWGTVLAANANPIVHVADRAAVRSTKWFTMLASLLRRHRIAAGNARG